VDASELRGAPAKHDGLAAKAAGLLSDASNVRRGGKSVANRTRAAPDLEAQLFHALRQFRNIRHIVRPAIVVVRIHDAHSILAAARKLIDSSH
jgi:hypothetical protein